MMHRYFPFALTATTLAVVATVTLGLLLSLSAGLAGVLVAAPLIAVFLRYCYLMLDGILSGEQEPPAITADIVNLLADRRALAQAVLLAAMTAVVIFTTRAAGFVYGGLCAAFLLLWAPASVAVLAVTGQPLLALWPPHLMAYSRTCGADHRQVSWVVLALGALLFGLLRFAAPRWMVLTTSQLILLIGFAMVGGTLLKHRKALGITEDLRTQREAARRASQLARLRERMLQQAYAKICQGKPLDGWREIQTWIVQNGRGDNAVEERKTLLAAASRWEDRRPADRIADDLISRFLAQGDAAGALGMLEERLAQNPRFVPSSTHRAQLADLATRCGKPALRQQIEAAKAAATRSVPVPRGR
jgi:hypothetical protein